MSFTRFNIKRNNKAQPSVFYDGLYSQTDDFFAAPEFTPHQEAVIDIKFFINEIAANFIKHDNVFIYVHIDLKISSGTLDGEIIITHDGNDFDPLSETSECYTIKAAASRITLSQKTGAGTESIYRKLKLKFNLKSWNKN